MVAGEGSEKERGRERSKRKREEKIEEERRREVNPTLYCHERFKS